MFTDDFYPVRNCSCCGDFIGYVVNEGKPYFDPHCGCMSYRIDNPRPVSDEEFQKFLDMLKLENEVR